MAARIIPFVQGVRRFSIPAMPPFRFSASRSNDSSCLHVVPAVEVLQDTQRQALRIVREVRHQQGLPEERHAVAVPKAPQRSQEFWDTLPLPQSQRDTPLSVVRRVMHLLFESAHSA